MPTTPLSVLLQRAYEYEVKRRREKPTVRISELIFGYTYGDVCSYGTS